MKASLRLPSPLARTGLLEGLVDAAAGPQGKGGPGADWGLLVDIWRKELRRKSKRYKTKRKGRRESKRRRQWKR